MPRRSGGGRSSSGGFGFNRSRAAPTRSAAAAAPPRSTGVSRPGMMSGLGGVMLQGMAFGAGSEVAHQAVRGIMGSGQNAQEGGMQQTGMESAQPMQDACSGQNYDFMQCLQVNPEHIGTCQSYLDLYKQCRQVQQ